LGFMVRRASESGTSVSGRRREEESLDDRTALPVPVCRSGGIVAEEVVDITGGVEDTDDINAFNCFPIEDDVVIHGKATEAGAQFGLTAPHARRSGQQSHLLVEEVQVTVGVERVVGGNAYPDVEQVLLGLG
jgi:hypothetical protein